MDMNERCNRIKKKNRAEQEGEQVEENHRAGRCRDRIFTSAHGLCK